MRKRLPVVFFLAAAAGCGGVHSAPLKPADDIDRLPHVETVLPEVVPSLAVRFEVTALVEAMEKADLCARVPGVVESLQLDPKRPEVDIGRRITAGEPLVKIAVPDLDAEKAFKEAMVEQAERQLAQAREAYTVATKEVEEAKKQVQRYQAEFEMRRAKHERTLKLVSSGSLQPEVREETQNQLAAAESAWQAAEAAIETKQAKLASAAADWKVAETRIKVARTDVQRLEAMVGYATLRAPFDGVVTKRWLDRGAMVKDTTTPLLTVMRTDRVRVLLDIPEREVPRVNATEQNPNADGQGDKVTIRIPSLKEVAGDEFRGTITRLGSAVDPATRTMRAEVHLDNRAGYLRPGMYGTAVVLLEERPNVLALPATALQRRGDQTEVFCVEGAKGEPLVGVARRVYVELGVDDGQRVQIRGGLGGKELVIARGNGVIREGDKVVAVPARPTEP